MSRNYVVDQINIENLVKVRLSFQALGVSFNDTWRARVQEELQYMTNFFLDIFEKNKGKMSSQDMFKALLPAFKKNMVMVENIRNMFGVEAATKFFFITAGIPEEVAKEYFDGNVNPYVDLYVKLSARSEWTTADKIMAEGYIRDMIQQAQQAVEATGSWVYLSSV